jgi:hypothetical protein
MGLERAEVLIEHTGESFTVMFNPEEYAIKEDNNYASQNIPGLSAPILQFTHGNMRTLDMELFFDTVDAGTDVRDRIADIKRLLEIDSDLHAPPVVQISWGSLQFRGVLASANQTFVKFLHDGRPVRARVNVTFNEFVDLGRESRAVNRQTANFTKVHLVRERETLSQIAGKHFKDPSMWRAIAIENGIDDPRADLTGIELRVPPLPYADPETGEVLR